MRIHAAVSAAAMLVWAAAGFIATPTYAAAAQCAEATVMTPPTMNNPTGRPLLAVSVSQTPATTPGGACWIDVSPYPFGSDGNPVTVLSATTASTTTLPVSALSLQRIPGQEEGNFGSVTVDDSVGAETLGFQGTGATLAQCDGVFPPCLTGVSGGSPGAIIPAEATVTFLSQGAGSTPATSANYETVTSLAFRAWNRGLATTTPDTSATEPNPPLPGTNAFGVWEYNGSRWTSIPYPGSSTCPGDTILWAGKLDYWLIGGSSKVLCRFDGENEVWETMTAPAAAFASGVTTTNINAGSCFAWDNCWFFGTGGAVLHWDGASLTAESVGVARAPWLGIDYEGATSATGASGAPIGVAVGGPVRGFSAPPIANAPEADPELFTSGGGPFAPSALDASESKLGDGPTNLVSVSFDASGDGWVAGNPLQNSSAATPYAPLFPISSAAGTGESCPATEDTFPGSAGSLSWFTWKSVAAVPDGSATVGGQETPPGIAVSSQPALVQTSCSGTPEVTTFQIPDPASPADQPITADTGGTINAVAASATNDAWAATSPANSSFQVGVDGHYVGPPHLYQWTDGTAPRAPAGNDVESRPVVTTSSPTVFVFPTPVTVAPPAPAPATTVKKAKPKKKKKRLPAAAYDISKPKLHRLNKKGSYRLTVTFKVRRKVTMGLEALHRGEVVARSGMRTFRGRSGALSVVVQRGRWPTGLKFVQPGKKS